MADENPYAIPTSEPLPVAADEVGEFIPASRGERFGGAFIDGIILAVLGALGSFALSRFTDFIPGLNEVWINRPVLQMLFYVALQTAGYFLVNGIFLAETGQTIGKKAMRIKIVTMEGAKPGIGTLIFRRLLLVNLASLIPEVGQYVYGVGILLIFLPQRRCLHDYLAGTKVVQVSPRLPKGFKLSANPDGTVVHPPALILSSLIWKHLDLDARSLVEGDSWTSDLAIAPEKLQAFEEEVLLKLQPKEITKLPATYGGLLKSLSLTRQQMLRTPARIIKPTPSPGPASSH